MNELKKQLNIIAKSNETYEKVVKIGNKYNLMIDLQGELSAEIKNVIMGFRHSKDFVKNIMISLEIDNDLARQIANDVNVEIFSPIQDKLQRMQVETEDDIEKIVVNDDLSKITPHAPEAVPQQTVKTVETPKPTPAFTITRPVTVEQAGQFTIEKEKTETNQYNSSNIERDKLLKRIENPEEIRPDHILENHTQANIESNPKPQPPAPTPSKPIIDKKYTSDPYREPI